MNSKKTGLYLGTFDPFHKGHYRSIENSLELVDEIIIQPHNPKVQSKKHISLEHRLNMCKLGSSKLNNVRVRKEKRNVYDLRKDGKYRYQLIKWVEEEIGRTPLVIMGSDKLNNKIDKDSKGELLEIPHIIFLRLEAHHPEPDLYIKAIKTLFTEVYLLKEVGDVSSSTIRELVRKGIDISRLVPKNVLKYIKENKLYI